MDWWDSLGCTIKRFIPESLLFNWQAAKLRDAYLTGTPTELNIHNGTMWLFHHGNLIPEAWGPLLNIGLWYYQVGGMSVLLFRFVCGDAVDAYVSKSDSRCGGGKTSLWWLHGVGGGTQYRRLQSDWGGLPNVVFLILVRLMVC